MMRLLTLRQPWASCVVAGIKSVENRSWSTSYRGDIAIIAGKGIDRDTRAQQAHMRLLKARAVSYGDALPSGGIIGVVELFDITSSMDDWWFVGPFGLCLRNARRTTLIPAKGTLGLAEVPDAVEDTIRKSIVRPVGEASETF